MGHHDKKGGSADLELLRRLRRPPRNDFFAPETRLLPDRFLCRVGLELIHIK